MKLFLLIFFSLIGIAGLYFKVDTGVFIGLGLAPWQIIQMKKNRILSIMVIIITTIAGAFFFAMSGKWLYLFLFILIESYNYWGYARADLNTSEGKQEDEQ